MDTVSHDDLGDKGLTLICVRYVMVHLINPPQGGRKENVINYNQSFVFVNHPLKRISPPTKE